jgi:hypothetical protein
MPTATVVVPEDQLSLAIGRSGQNARLAAKLSGWRIDIKGLFEGTSDTLFKIQDDPRYAQYQDLEATTIPRIEAILGKKAEGRPITPEEYRELHYFNNRVESGLLKEKQEITKQQQARIQAAKDAVPDDAYDLPIMTLGLPTKVENLLGVAGFATVGELAYRLLLVPDSILDIDGIGPSYISQIESALEVMISYQPLPEELAIPEDLLVESESDSLKADEIKTEPSNTVEGETPEEDLEEEAETDEDVEEAKSEEDLEEAAKSEEDLEEEAKSEEDLEEEAEIEGEGEEEAETGEDAEEELKESLDEEQSEELADEEESGSKVEDDAEEEVLDSEEVIEEEQIETEVEREPETAVVEEPEVDVKDKVETDEEESKAPEVE